MASLCPCEAHQACKGPILSRSSGVELSPLGTGQRL